jgi:alginate O-acetyltransferase complex protein AlgI
VVVWLLLAVFCVGRVLALPEFAFATLLGFGFTLCRLGHYAIERQRGSLPRHEPLDLFAYAFFFPVLAIGPIVRFETFLRERDRHRWDDELAAEGLERILYGYAKVVFGANYVVGTVLSAQVLLILGTDVTAAVVVAQCVLQGAGMYLAFSGYSDIAIGSGRLLGIRLPENFDFPFLRPNIAEFWENWHATLSAWCRAYVSLPVAGWSRSRSVGLVASMVMLGLWHEFTLRFVLWGAWHGMGLAVFRLWRDRVTPHLPAAEGPVARAAARVAATSVTLVFVLSSLVWTKTERFEDTLYEVQVLLGGPWL